MMTADLILVLALLGVTVVMFAFGRPKMDYVALLMVTLLPLLGLVSFEQSLAGFSDPNVLLIVALFVVGEALVRTGVAQSMGDFLVARAGPNEARLLVLLMVLVAGIGAFMSSTGVVAIFIPVVLRVASTMGLAPGRLMMPLSVAALISGMMTLVATAPNLVVSGALERAGQPAFGFFAFTPFGVPILVGAILWMLFARRFLARDQKAAPDHRPRLSDWVADYGLEAHEFRMRLAGFSPWVGQRLDALDLRSSQGLQILAIERGTGLRATLISPTAQTVLQAADILHMDIRQADFDASSFAQSFGLIELSAKGDYFTDLNQDIGMVEILVPPTSALLGRSVTESRFRSEHGLLVIGLKREGLAQSGPIAHQSLRLGDQLLAVGPWQAIRDLRHDRDVVTLTLPMENAEVIERPTKAPFALATLALVIVLMATGVVANLQAALIGCLLLGAFGCVTLTEAYRSVHWPSIVVIVGMLPFSLALQQTGGVDLAARGLLHLVGEASPRFAMAAIFGVTAIMGLFISNTATAVLMAPVALAVAQGLGLSALPFAMTVALAASAAFVTPVSSPVNMLVIGPGGYGFGDFVKIGLPLLALVLAVCLIGVPLVMPF